MAKKGDRQRKDETEADGREREIKKNEKYGNGYFSPLTSRVI